MSRFPLVPLVLLFAVYGLARPERVDAATYEYDLLCRVGTITGDFKDEQTLHSPAIVFPDQPITLNVGDTVVLNLLFDQVVQVFDFGTPNPEHFSFGLDWSDPNVGPWAGTWSSSVEALGAKGDIWVGPYAMNFGGSGAGIGWGGVGVPVTNSHGSLTGIRWIATITSATEGVLPLRLTAFTGIQFGADAIKLSPLPPSR
jgi:hypothetical protein